MYKAAPQAFPISDQISIYWWRLVIFTTRRLHRVKRHAQPVVSPFVPYLWVPLLALMCGVLIGWVIAVA